MPDDIAAHMQGRGARPVTIRARMTEGERLQRHAAWRLPMEHADSPLIDRLYADGKLTPRQYANACACMRLFVESGQGRSRGVASWLRERGGHKSGEARGPEDDWRDLLRCTKDAHGFAAVCALLRNEEQGPYEMSRAQAKLDDLDAVAAKWDGERYHEDR